MNKLTKENISVIAELLSPLNQPMVEPDIRDLKDTNIVMKWLCRLTDASYESWKRQGAHDGF